MTFNPTPEQQEALRLFSTGRSLAIEAGAGAGKTSTLRLLAGSTSRRGQYIAFNKAIVAESKAKMPSNVECSTAHSLAYRAIVPGTRYAERLRNSRRMKSAEIARLLGIDDAIVVRLATGEEKRLSPSLLAGIAMRGVIRFCQSADAEPDARHVPYIDGIDVPPVVDGRRVYDNNNRVAATLVEPMRRAWADIVDERGALPFRHDHYLKLWHLSGPRINASFILFDEAQDANPVLVDIVRQQTQAQLVWVGDSQQQIYSFTGAINALATVGAEQRAFLTRSFRFGPEVAAVANRCLDALDAELRIEGAGRPGVVAPVADPDAILCRTNATAVRAFLDALVEERRPHLVGGGREVVDFAKAAVDLQDRGWTSHPDLACFKSWAEVEEYVAQDEQGSDLRLLVKLIDEFGADRIIATLERMPKEEAADVVISTAHKAKGREWDAVRLAADFPADPAEEELRLLYVAVTRARLRLDVSAIEFLLGDPAEEEAEEIDDPDHGDPTHDFASCPVCIAESRAAEADADAEDVPGATSGLPSASETTSDPDVPEAAHGRESGSYEVYSGRGGGPIRVSNVDVAIAHARDIHERTGRHTLVLDPRGELVVDFDR